MQTRFQCFRTVSTCALPGAALKTKKLPPATSATLRSMSSTNRNNLGVSATSRSNFQDSLLRVPGIGERAATLLEKENVTSLPALVDMYEQQLNRDKQELISFLSKVGIKGRWRSSIANYVAEQTNEDSTSKVTFCVEGNIGSGKTTYLNMVKQRQRQNVEQPGQRMGQLHELIEVVPEPVESWQDVDGANLLDIFYKDPQRYAYTFQSYVFVTRLLQENQSRKKAVGMRLLERSVFCDRMVFVKAVHEAHQMNDLELKLYDSWFNPMLTMNPNLTPDGFVYLQTNPDTCMRRLKMRNRSEETGIQDTYLEKLQEFHESWLVEGGLRMGDLLDKASSRKIGDGRTVIKTQNTLFPSSSSGSDQGMSVQMRQLDQSRDLIIPQVPDLLKGSIVLLDQNRLQMKSEQSANAMSSLHMVPALHVDCDADIDIHDPDMMAARADVMSAYRSWVGQYRKVNERFFTDQRSTTSSGLIIPDEDTLRRLEKIPAGKGSLEVLHSIMQNVDQRV